MRIVTLSALWKRLQLSTISLQRGHPDISDGDYQVADILQSKKQWTDKLKDWNLKKNVSSEEMKNIARIQHKRRTEQDKETRFRVRSRLVTMENIERWQKRRKLKSGGSIEVPFWVDRSTIHNPFLGHL